MSQSVRTSSFTLIIAFLCMAIVGIALLPLLPVRLHPSRVEPSLTVSFSLPNSSARVVEMEVTSKLEAMLARMKGVRSIDSRSRNGSGSISVKLDKHADIEVLRFETASIVRQAWSQLPEGTSYPQVKVNSPDDNALRPFLTYTLNAPVSPALIGQYAEEYIHPPLARIKGIHQVNISGTTPMEWHLTYDPHQLTILGVTPANLQSAIRTHYSTVFIGKANQEDEGWMQLAVLPDTNEGDGLPLDEIVVRNRDNHLIRLSELVRAERRETPPQSYYRINGLNSIYLSITAEETANQLVLGKEVKSVVDALRANLPEGYEIHISYDATEHIDKELNQIFYRNGLTVLILLVFVVLLTRRWRYVVLVTVSLIVNLAIAVVCYYLTSIEIQLYTLAGITISLNLIIDNTIVIADHLLHRHNLRTYLSILAATLTTICALAVVLFLDEKLRANLQDFSVVVIINLTVSLMVALFFVPSLMEKLGMTQRIKNEKIGIKRRSRFSIYFIREYERIIRIVCRHRVTACTLLLLTFGLPVFLLPEKMKDDEGWHGLYNQTIGSDYYQEKIRPIVNMALGGTWRLFVEKVYNGSYFNDEHETVLHVSATLPNGSTLEQMNELITRMEEYLKSKLQTHSKGENQKQSANGNSVPRNHSSLSLNTISQFQTYIYSPYRASIDIHFPKEHQYSGFPYQLKADLTARALELGGGSWSIYGLEDQGFNNNVRESAGSYRVRISGYNYDELYGYAEALRDTLLTHRRVREVLINSAFSWYKDDYKEFHFNVIPGRLAENDLTLTELYDPIHTLFARNLSCGTIRTANGSYENVRLSSSQTKKYDTWQLSYMPLTSDRKSFKLYSLGDVGIHQQSQEVVKNNQQYTLFLQYEYIGAYQLGNKMLERTLEAFNKQLPSGYEARSEMGRNRWKSEDNSQYLLLLMVAAVIFIVTSILFNSLRCPFTILFLIPVSYIGVFLTFWLFELNFDQGGFAALILLCGITVNAGIYLLDEYNDFRKLHPSLSPLRAYLKAWNVKIIPILLTILSTILGFVPFMIGNEKESFWFPLAAGTIGGLFMSLVGLFIFLPLFCLPRKAEVNS